MNTFRQLWHINTPAEAQKIISEQRVDFGHPPENLEEQALALVGTDIYNILIKEYTEKQWGRPCSELPSFIIKRLPLRFTYDNNYFNDLYQGIPIGGYTQIFEKLLSNCEVRLKTPYTPDMRGFTEKVIYTGAIDEYFDFLPGALEYRSLRFETETLECENYQGNAVINFTSHDVPYTRIIEHKHFDSSQQSPNTIITREYPAAWEKGAEPYYPVNDARNGALYNKYVGLAKQEKGVIFGGRLGTYAYKNMDQVIRDALELSEQELSNQK
jgi:UDP-galactopyranose mutase